MDKDSIKVTASIFILLFAFFSFGWVQRFLLYTYELSIGGILIGQRDTLAVIFTGVTALAIFAVLKYRRGLSTIVNFVSFAAAALVLFNIGSAVAANNVDRMIPSKELSLDSISDLNTSQQPDIYFLIFDSYGRADVLQDGFSFDNSNFIKFLSDRGFFIADKSRANYPMASESSLAATLNMRYLNDAEHTVALIKQNAVLPIMQSIGYDYVHIGSGWYATNENRRADIQFTNEHPSGSIINEFSMAIFNQTLALPISEFLGFNMAVEKYTQKHAQDFEHSMEWLRKVPAIESPTFTFSHNFPPHSPFVFDRNGNVLDPMRFSGFGPVEALRKAENQAYIDQLVYVNKSIMKLVDYILEQSAPSVPAIIIQGDHGPPTSTGRMNSNQHILERSGALNAYLLPPHCNSVLYPEISLVNTFRALLNSCFQGTIDLLADETYWISSHPNLNTNQPPIDFSKIQ